MRFEYIRHDLLYIFVLYVNQGFSKLFRGKCIILKCWKNNNCAIVQPLYMYLITEGYMGFKYYKTKLWEKLGNNMRNERLIFIHQIKFSIPKYVAYIWVWGKIHKTLPQKILKFVVKCNKLCFTVNQNLKKCFLYTCWHDVNILNKNCRFLAFLIYIKKNSSAVFDIILYNLHIYKDLTSSPPHLVIRYRVFGKSIIFCPLVTVW